MTNAIPAGWATANLTSLFEFKYGKSLPRQIRAAEGAVSVYGSGGRIGSHDRPLTKGPTVVIGRKGSVGEVSYSPEPCWPIDTTYFIDDFPREFSPKYWSLYLEFLQLGQRERSSAIPGISRSDLSGIEVPVPPPVEQRRIVAKLEDLLSRVDECDRRLEKVPVLLEQFRDSALSSACSGRLTANWRERTIPATAVGESRAVTGWTERTLSDFGTWGTGGTPSRQNPAFFIGPIPWVKSGDLNDGLLTSTEEQITPAALEASSARVLPKGTVSMAMYGATIGKVAVLGIDAATNQACANCQVDVSRVEPWFLYYLLFSQRRAFIAAGQGGAQPNMSLTMVKRWQVSLPPLDEQRKIVRCLDSLLSQLGHLEAVVTRSRMRLRGVRSALLDKAFRGELA